MIDLTKKYTFNGKKVKNIVHYQTNKYNSKILILVDCGDGHTTPYWLNKDGLHVNSGSVLKESSIKYSGWINLFKSSNTSPNIF